MSFVEDNLIDDLLGNIDLIGNYENVEDRNLLTALSSQSDSGNNTVHHVIYVNRVLRQRKSSAFRKKRYKPVILPRILKHDIRRKYPEMFQNVMNSYDQSLITSFFKKFFVPDCKMFKIVPGRRNSHAGGIVGIDMMTSLMLLFLQSTPDRVTTLSNIQIISRSDSEGIDVTCTITVKHTQVYDISTHALVHLALTEFHEIRLESNQNLEITTLRKRKCGVDSDLHSRAEMKETFDPIRGNFCETRFTRLQTPIPFYGEGKVTFKVNAEKEIANMMYTPIREVTLVKGHCS